MAAPKTSGALHQLPRIALNLLQDMPGARQQAIRAGRGRSSRRGGTAGRGDKGAGQHSRLKSPYLGFAGGQTSMLKTQPKRGAVNPFKIEYEPVNLARIQEAIASGKLCADRPIDVRHLWLAGAVSKKITNGVKLLATGHEVFTSPVTLEVSRASRSAIAAVEKAGGTIKCVYHTPLTLQALLKPHKFAVLPRAAFPKTKLRVWYENPANRGYLAPTVMAPGWFYLMPFACAQL